MSMEKAIEGVIKEQLESGMIEKIVAEQLQKGVENAVEKLFCSYGDVTKVIKSNIESVVIPYIEGFDYSRYVTKLDAVLTEVLKESTQEHRTLLENFSTLMSSEEAPKTIRVSEIFTRWMDFVAKEVDVSGLEVDFDDGEPMYEAVYCKLEVVEDEGSRSWSSFDNATLIFECEEDEDLNTSIRIHKWKDKPNDTWTIVGEINKPLNSLRYLSKFDLFLMQLTQRDTKIVVDEWNMEEEVRPEEEPEPTY